jgi:hypothetical protein
VKVQKVSLEQTMLAPFQTLEKVEDFKMEILLKSLNLRENTRLE